MRGGARHLCSAALFAATALCLLAARADASTSVVLALPSSASPTLLGASDDGEYIAYLAVPVAGGGGGERELHWYDLQTEEDVTVGSVPDTDVGQISADGRHLVFSAWSSGPPGANLVVGTVYEATVGEDGQVTYEQVSPTATTYPGGGLETQYGFPTSSADGSLVAYSDYENGRDYVWSRATQMATQVATGPWPTGPSPAVLSSDGSVLGVLADEGNSVVEYAVPDSSVVRSVDVKPTVNQVNLYGLSADGSYGVGFGYGTEAQTGYAFLDFLEGTIHVIPNSFDGQCTGSNHSPVAISEDGRTVAFGSLATGLSPDPAGGSLGYFSYEPESEVVTNHSGAYAGPPPSGGCPSVAMSGDGQTMYFVSNVEPSLTSGWIEGTVTDEGGSPLSNAAVTFYEAGAPVAVVLTRADGTYVSQGLPAGSYKVGFSTSSEVGNYAPQYFSGKPSLASAETVQVTAGAVSSGVDAHLAPGGEITGTVTAAGSPLQHVEVDALDTSGGSPVSVGTALTGADGNYTISGLPTGDFVVKFSANSEVGNYAPQYFSDKASLGAAEPVHVTAGAVSSGVDAHLAPGGEFTDTATSAPLPGASVSGISAALHSEGAMSSGVHTSALGLGGPTTPRTASAPVTDDAYIYETAISGSGGGAPPTNAAPPSISGEARQGLTLTEVHGQWLNEPTSYSYQWQQCDGYGTDCIDIGSASGSTYAPTAAQVGDTIRVEEWAHNDQGTSPPAASVPTTPVAAEAVSPPGSGGAGPSGADSPPSPNPRLAHRRSRCRKGFRKKVVKGRVKCTKAKHHRKRR